MKCSCGSHNFIREGHNYHCAGCGKCLRGDELRKFKEEINREYKRCWAKNHRKYLPGASIREISIIKKVSIRTVYRSVHLFDLIPGYRPARYKFNDKIFNWRKDA